MKPLPLVVLMPFSTLINIVVTLFHLAELFIYGVGKTSLPDNLDRHAMPVNQTRWLAPPLIKPKGVYRKSARDSDSGAGLAQTGGLVCL